MVNLDGIQYPLMAGVGAFIGILAMIPMALLGIWFPALFPWLWVPVTAGAVCGFIGGFFVG